MSTASRDAAPPASLRVLLDHVIDYAGLYPPARLPMEDAIHQYSQYRQDTTAWMINRFVCGVAHLKTLDAYALLFAQNPPFTFSVLGSGGQDTSAFQDTLADDLEAIHTFHRRHPEQVRVEAVETRLPADLLNARLGAVRRFLDDVTQRLEEVHLPELEFFFELPIDETLADTLSLITEAFAAHKSGTMGLKMRLGGDTPADHPAPEHPAAFIAACRDAEVRFKATAGLHHPFRHYNKAAETHMHGFLNVFGGAVLAHWHTLDVDRIAALLADEEPDHFTFTDDTFRWQDLEADSSAIRSAREHLAVSFGSCSFDEPRDDLRVLGLL